MSLKLSSHNFIICKIHVYRKYCNVYIKQYKILISYRNVTVMYIICFSLYLDVIQSVQDTTAETIACVASAMYSNWKRSTRAKNQMKERV